MHTKPCKSIAAGARWSLAGMSCFLLAWGILNPHHASAVGTWRKLTRSPAGPVNLMLLLSDGTVMAADSTNTYIISGGARVGLTVSNKWYKLTPLNGSYVDGNWTVIATMNSTRRFYSSAVLRDGRVLVAGAEYGTGSNTSEVYNPVTNQWTAVPIPAGLLTTNNTPTAPTFANTAGFTDSACSILPDGRVLVAPNNPVTANQTLIFDPAGNGSWSAGPVTANFGNENEASWIKLPDDTLLTVDLNTTNSERYIPTANGIGTWRADAAVGAALYSTQGSEIGAGLLLSNGKALLLGGNSNTRIYTPSGNPATNGSWAAGPSIPNVENSGGTLVAGGAPDAGAAMMPSGKILCAFGPAPTAGTGNVFRPPTSFFECNVGGTAFTQVNGPNTPGAITAANGLRLDNVIPYQTMMLVLPDGSILYSHENTDLYIYTPDIGDSADSPLAAGKPTITGITANADGSYHLTGTGLNGISCGAAYGDDAQMDSNYPLVRLVDSGGQTRYARTFNWSSTGVVTGGASVSTDFAIQDIDINSVPGGGPGFYTLDVSVNGNHSDSIQFNGPVWVAFNWNGVETGSFATPYRTLQAALNAAALLPGAGRTIRIKGPSSSAETFPSISIPVSIISIGGPATVGK